VYVGLLDDGSLKYVVGTPEEITGGVLLVATDAVSGVGCDIDELAFLEL